MAPIETPSETSETWAAIEKLEAGFDDYVVAVVEGFRTVVEFECLLELLTELQLEFQQPHSTTTRIFYLFLLTFSFLSLKI